jgi:predicted metallo-beta-lactamase superfamily hydrolase
LRGAKTTLFDAVVSLGFRQLPLRYYGLAVRIDTDERVSACPTRKGLPPSLKGQSQWMRID